MSPSRLATACALVLAVLGGACGSGPTAPSSIGWQATLAPGQAASIDGTGFSIRFDEVSGDSRCPGDALCIHGGDAIVAISVIEGTTTMSYDLHTGFDSPAVYQDLTITLVSLDPYPFSSRPFDPSEYRATLRATR